MMNHQHAPAATLQRREASKRNRFRLSTPLFLFALLSMVCACVSTAYAQVNGVGKLPDLGWGSFSQQLMNSQSWLNEANIKAQSDALKASGLQSHGYVFINLDSGWQSGWDQYGRPEANPGLFPDGLAATVQYIHNNGQKAGIYWIPGIEQPDYNAGGVIQGTSYPLAQIVETSVPGNAFSYGTTCCNYYHMKIDFTKPGAQLYVNSVVQLFASWGFDAIKLDGVTPGSDIDNLFIDNRAEVQAWSQAIAQSGRPMELTVSWNLDHDYLSTWQQYANARRIEDDVNCYCVTETQWPEISRLFGDLEKWQNDAGPTKGWNDLDSLLVGNGAVSGLTQDERQSAMTLWAISNSPMIIGDDLTQIDAFGLQLLGNDAVIAVDQSGAPAQEITAGQNPVWASPQLAGGSYNVALFNLNSSASTTTVNLSSLGITGSADVYDLWVGQDLGTVQTSYAAPLNKHASALLRITPTNSLQAPAAPAHLTAISGNAQVALSWNASTGASSYNVYRGTASGGEILLAPGLSSTSYTDTSVINGSAYYYEVSAVNKEGESQKSTEVSATPQLVLPAAPTGLTAVAGSGSVTLAWTATAGSSSYNIYRGVASGAETQLATGVSSPAYADKTVTNGVTYYYEVTAVSGAGEGTKSAEVSATPQLVLPAAPTGLTASAGNGSVVLTWTTSASATSYNVYRGATSGSESSLATNVSSTTYTDSTAVNGTSYFYEVTAVNGNGESVKSNEVSATPTAGFTLTSSATALTLSNGSATSVLTITPNGDARTLTFTCTGLNAAYTCGFSPSSLPMQGVTTNKTVTLTVSSQTSRVDQTSGKPAQTGRIVVAVLLPSLFFMGLLMPGACKRGRKAFLAIGVLAVLASLGGCGGSSGSQQQQQNPTLYSFQVNVLANGSSVQTLDYSLSVQ